jgi:hypothetical protein
MKIITMFLILAIVLTGLPVFVEAQTRYKPGTYKPGTSEYYSDDAVITTVTHRVAVKRIGSIHIGGDPQVRGGLYNIPPAADEEDVELDREIMIGTMSASKVLYIGRVSPVLDNGTKVIVRRKKLTLKIIAIVNCGNWSRQFGAEVEKVLDKQTEFLPCRPFEDGRRKIRDELIGNTRFEEFDDGCKKEVIKTITVVDKTTVCIEGSWLEVVRHGNDYGKVSGKKFKAVDVIPSSIQAEVFAQSPELREKKVKFLQVLQGACESEKQRFKLVWFTGDGGWHWKEFLIGLGAGFLVGYLVRGTPDCPVLIPPSTPTKTPALPIRPNTGSSSSSSVTGTRPRRP